MHQPRDIRRSLRGKRVSKGQWCFAGAPRSLPLAQPGRRPVRSVVLSRQSSPGARINARFQTHRLCCMHYHRSNKLIAQQRCRTAPRRRAALHAEHQHAGHLCLAAAAAKAERIETGWPPAAAGRQRRTSARRDGCWGAATQSCSAGIGLVGVSGRAPAVASRNHPSTVATCA